MAKPTLDDTRFAVTAGGADASNMSAPSGGQKDTGWTLNQVPTSSVFNWWWRKAHAWFQFFDGMFDASINLTLPVNASVTISGTGFYRHGPRTLSLPSAAFAGSATPALQYASSLVHNAALNTAFSVFAPIILPVGSRILAIRAFVADSGVGPTKLQATLFSTVASTGTPTTVASSAVSAGNATFQTLTISPLTTVMTTGNAYQIGVATTTGTDVAAVIAAEVDYDQP